MMAEAGVTGPYPRPISAAPSSTSGIEPVAASAMPVPASSRQTWLTRTAPKRATGPALLSAAVAANRYTSEVKMPTAAAETPIASCAAGASTGGENTAKDTPT